MAPAWGECTGASTVASAIDLSRRCPLRNSERETREGNIMTGALISEGVIPARHGRACEVGRGEVLRIHLSEGKQVGESIS